MDDTIRSCTFFRNLTPGFRLSGSELEARLLSEYGAMFVARGGVLPPPKMGFESESEVYAYQNLVEVSSLEIGGFTMELQTPAMEALVEAIADAESLGLSITPRGADSARRNYAGTVELWASRVEPALEHWTALGRISKDEADDIRKMSPLDQIGPVLKLEEQGIWFAKDLSKTILYSVAAPGTSQHLAMLAFDITEHNDPQVRAVMNRHHWYQTVISDLPHFTYLGADETYLPDLGLKKITDNDRDFWIPDI